MLYLLFYAHRKFLAEKNQYFPFFMMPRNFLSRANDLASVLLDSVYIRQYLTIGLILILIRKFDIYNFFRVKPDTSNKQTIETN